MILSVTVKNIALIEELTIDFEKGFTVFSGETGAGKSIIIGALGFLFGSKATSDIIRKDQEEALVSASFLVQNNKQALLWLKEHEISYDDDTVLIRRNIKVSGRSSAWIQSTPVTRAELEEFTSFLADIHGQHDHQSLFRVSEHRRFLDSFAGIENEVEEYSSYYTKLTEVKAQLESLNLSEAKKQERLDYLQYAIDEISKAKLKPNEDLELEAEAKRLDGFEKLFSNLQETVEYTSANSGAVHLLKKALHSLEVASTIDDDLKPTFERFSNQYYEIEDTCNEIYNKAQKLNFDENRRDEIQERLSLIYKLKKKYCESQTSGIEGIFAFEKKASEELSTLENSLESKASLEQNLKELQTIIYKKGQLISKARQEASTHLQQKIEAVLKTLGMQKTQFQVRVEKKETEGGKQKAGPYGFDDIEFLISPNLGEPVKPLAKIASGGELSRVMLAIKTVLAQGDSVGTMVFDEVDTGIGGEVALSVAEHIKKLSTYKQIFCVTHLAVIASHADNQIKIEKSFEGNTTKTGATKVTGEKRVEEIARMLSGDEDSSVSILHAKELLKKYQG